MLGVSVRELLARPWRALLTGLAAVIGVSLVAGSLVLVDTAERSGATGDDVRILGGVVLAAGGVALLVGSFIVNSAWSVTLAQRTRELALLRCLGAEPSQLRRLVWLEATIVGAAASLAGLGIGVGVAAALRAFVNSSAISGDVRGHVLVVSPRTVVCSLLAGVVVMLLSALAPTRRASRAAPLAALRDVPVARGRRGSAARASVGAALVAAGIGVVPLTVATSVDFLLLAGAALTLIGVRLAGPLVARPLAGAAGLPVAHGLRLPGALAREIVMRSPERTAATASTLMIGLALISFIAVLSASAKAFIEAEFARSPDVTVISGAVTGGAKAATPAGISRTVVARLQALRELSTLVPVVGSDGMVAGVGAHVQSADLARFARVQGLDVTAGSLADVSPGGLWVIDDIASARGLTVGSRVPVTLARGTRTLTVRAVYRHETYASSSLPRFLIGAADYAAPGGTSSPARC